MIQRERFSSLKMSAKLDSQPQKHRGSLPAEIVVPTFRLKH
jgi:hypothetical protein